VHLTLFKGFTIVLFVNLSRNENMVRCVACGCWARHLVEQKVFFSISEGRSGQMPLDH
jgi:hypothetical protein